MLRGVDEESEVFVQGPGFNVGPGALQSLQGRIRKITAIPASLCPAYTFNVWNNYIRRYPPLVADLHEYGLAAFFLSRYDGAFYRQFGVSAYPRKKFIEVRVAECYCDALLQLSLASNDLNVPKLSSALLKATHIRDSLISMSEAHFVFAENSRGGAEEMWKEIYELWASLNHVDYFFLIPLLTHVIISVFEELSPQPHIKEYDGFTAHCMLRAVTDSTQPTADEHSRLVHVALHDEVQTSDLYIRGLALNMNHLIKRGTIHVVHDIGLDPMVDDFIALKILSIIYKIGILLHCDDV